MVILFSSTVAEVSCWPSRSASRSVVGSRSRRAFEQPAQSDDVVRRRGEREDPGDQRAAAMMQLAEVADRFHPAEALFHQLPLLLTDGIARMACRPAIDRAP